jgi:uracil-DNA glycosylase
MRPTDHASACPEPRTVTRPAPDLTRHLDQVRACRLCPTVQAPPVLGPVPGARVYLMGQAPGPREMTLGRPFAFTAGATLFRWFASIGVDEAAFRARVYMAAAIRCFPGKLPNKQGDRKPSRAEVAACRPFWECELALLRPGLVLPVGKLAIEQFLPPSTLEEVVGQSFRVERAGHACDVVPLPHPSGLSRWIQTPGGKAAIGRALQRIAAHPDWRATFGTASNSEGG